MGDLVAIRRTQTGPGLKLFFKYLEPYEVSKVKSNHRYDVIKAGDCEGPHKTSTAADSMKLWVPPESDDEDEEKRGNDRLEEERKEVDEEPSSRRA